MPAVRLSLGLAELIVDMMTVWAFEGTSLAVGVGGGVVGGSGTKADTTLEMRPVLLAESMARMAKYLREEKSAQLSSEGFAKIRFARAGGGAGGLTCS